MIMMMIIVMMPMTMMMKTSSSSPSDLPRLVRPPSPWIGEAAKSAIEPHCQLGGDREAEEANHLEGYSSKSSPSSSSSLSLSLNRHHHYHDHRSYHSHHNLHQATILLTFASYLRNWVFIRSPHIQASSRAKSMRIQPESGHPCLGHMLM